MKLHTFVIYGGEVTATLETRYFVTTVSFTGRRLWHFGLKGLRPIVKQKIKLLMRQALSGQAMRTSYTISSVTA